jgi:hypothetical protein
LFETGVSIVPPEPLGSENILEIELVTVHVNSTLQPLGIEPPGVAFREHVGGF